MKKIIASVFAFTALAVGAGGIASADEGKADGKPCHGKKGKWHGKRIMKKLIKAGAVTQEEVAALKPAWKEARACMKAVKAGSQPKGSCKEKFATARAAKLQLLEGSVSKITDAKLKERVEKHIAKIKAHAEKKGS